MESMVKKEQEGDQEKNASMKILAPIPKINLFIFSEKNTEN